MRALIFFCIFCLPVVIAEIFGQDTTPWTVTFDGREYANEQTTFSYTVNALSAAGLDMGRWILAVPNCNEVSVVTAQPLGVTAIDSQSGVNGYQWSIVVPTATSRVFKLVVDGHVNVLDIEYVLAGMGESPDYFLGRITGPDCSLYNDPICEAGVYTGSCQNGNIVVGLHSSSQHVAHGQQWSTSDPLLNLDNPSAIAPILHINPLSLQWNTQVCSATHKVNLVVYGADGNADCVATINIEDSVDPTFVGLYADDITVESDDIPAPPDVWARDNCDTNIIVITQETTEGTNPAAQTIIRTWSATDFCTNVIEHVQTITVRDTTPPELRGVEDHVTAECDTVPPPCEVEAYDYNDVTVTMTQARFPHADNDCDYYYILIRTWTAVDAAGNTDADSQTITVQDSEPPIISGTPESETVQCNNVPSAPSLIAMDACGPNTLTFQEIRNDGITDDDYRLIRTWSASDECGNGVEHLQTIHVEDTEDPVLGGVDEDITVACNEIPPPCVVTVADNCDASLDVTYEQVTENTGCEDEYNLIRTWSAEDQIGNTVMQSQTISVGDQTLPKFTGLPPATLTVECSDIPNFVVDATDKCDPNIVVTFTETKSTNPTSWNEYFLYRNWLAVDRCGNQAQHNQQLKVQDTVGPTLEGVPHDIHVSCNSVPLLENSYVTVVDKCGCDAPLTVTASETLTSGSCDFEYSLFRLWSSMDCAGNAVSEGHTITVSDTESPVMTGLPGDQQVQCSAIPDPVTVGVSDNCDTSVVVVPSHYTNGGSCPNQYTLVRTWTATDVCGNTVEHSQNIAVNDNSPPTFTSSNNNAQHTFECSGDAYDSMDLTDTGTPVPEASDTCDDNVDVSHIDTQTVGTCINDITVVREYTASDVCGNSISQVQTFVVTDSTPPQLESDFSLESTVQFPATDLLANPPTVTGVDSCNGLVTVDATEDIESWPPCPGRSFKVVRTWKATDVCGNVSPLLEQVVNVEDTAVPLLIGGPDDVDVGCHNVPPPASVTGTDGAEGDVTVVYTAVISNRDCDHSYLLTRVWVATDECGNSDSVRQEINVADGDAPVLTGVPADQTTECDFPAPPVVTVTDNCDPNVIVVGPVDTQVEGTTPEVKWIMTRTWTSTDICGNSVSKSQVVTVLDTLPPVFDYPPLDITVECSDDLGELPVVSASDICDDTYEEAVVVTHDVKTFQTEVCDDYIVYHRTWIAVDEAEHNVQTVQVVVVKDTVGPNFVNIPEHSTVQCGTTIPIPDAEASDDCDPNVDEPTVETTEMHPEASSQFEYSTIYEFTAEDRCGNTAYLSVTVTTEDKVAPTFEPFDSIVHLTCADSISDQATVGATDDCYDVTPTHTDETVSQPCPDSYTVVRTWSVEDGSGNQISTTQTFIVSDSEAPVVEAFQTEIDVTHDSIPSYPTLTVTDDCADVTPVWTDETDAVVCDNSYRLTYTGVFSDNCGHATTVVQRVNVLDPISPTIVHEHEDKTIQCDDIASLASMSDVSTADPSASIISTEEFTENLNCADSYTIRRVWIAEDDCGNKATYTQVITVVDTVDPVFESAPVDATTFCSATDPPTLEVTDNCAPSVTVTAVVSKINIANPTNYQLQYTWSYTDPCGNAAVQQQIVTVVDNIPPEISSVPSDVTVTVDQIPSASADTVTCNDNCGTVFALYDTEKIDGSCEIEFTLVRTWVCVDAAGLQVSSVPITVTIQDTGASLVFDNFPADQTIAWRAGLPEILTVPTVNVNDVSLSVDFTTSNTADPDAATDYEFLIFRYWRAEDVCGQVEDHAQTITVYLQEPPVFPPMPADIYVSCELVGPWITTKIDQITLQIQEEIPVDNTLASDVVTEGGSCVNQYNIIVSWTATDEAGQTVSDSFTIFVSDTQSPSFVLPTPPSTTSDACDMPQPPAVDANDNCQSDLVPETPDGYGDSQGAVEVLLTVAQDGDDLMRTWTATDKCGHSIVTTQRVTISDVTAPSFEQTTLPSDLVVDCDSIPPQDTLTAIDDCDDPVEVKSSEQFEYDHCLYTITRLWTVTDTSGNTVSHSQVIQVSDTEAPTFTTDPLPAESLTIECDNVHAAETLVGTDNCGQALVNVIEEPYNSQCTPYDIVRTWEVKDNCGLTSVHVQTITVQDNELPVVSGVLPDETRECDDLAPPSTVTVSDNCDTIEPLLIPSVSVADGDCPASKIVTHEWTVMDCSGDLIASLAQTQVVTYLDRTPPSLVGITDDNRYVVVTCGSTGGEEPVVIASDNCDHVSLNHGFIPHLVEQTVSQENSNNYVVHRTWTVTDSCGNSASDVQTVVYEDVTPPTIECGQDVFAACESTSSDRVTELNNFPPTTSDACGQVSLTGPVLQQKVNEKCEGAYDEIYHWTATDASGLVASCEQTVNVVDGNTPTFEIIPHDSQISCDDAIPDPSVVSIVDACSSSVSYDFSETSLGGSCDDESMITRTWVAVDDCGLQNSHTQYIGISDFTPPTLTGVPDDSSYSCESVPEVDNHGVTAIDTCDPDVSVEFLSEVENPECDDNKGSYQHTLTWAATDRCGNTVEAFREVDVYDETPPAIVVPDHVTVDCAVIPEVQPITAVDNCHPDLVAALSTLRIDGPSPWQYEVVRSWSATDPCGNEVSSDQTVTVTDDNFPVFTFYPEDTSYQCHDLYVVGPLTATDNCLDAPTVNQDGPVVQPGTCPGNYYLITTWTATDLAGNDHEWVQTITFTDTIAPVFTSYPQNVQVECDQIPHASPLHVTDECTQDIPAVNPVDTKEVVQSLNDYSLLRTWEAEDSCGNVVSHTQTIYVKDTEKPVFSLNAPADIVVSCASVPDPDDIQGVDNCVETIVVVYKEYSQSGDCPDEYTLFRTWTATDLSGNEETMDQEITVHDDQGPQLTPEVTDQTISCDQPHPVPTLTANDLCAGDVSVAFLETTEHGDNPNTYVLTRTWTATDFCGLSNVWHQIVTVNDDVPPNIQGNSDATVEVGNVPVPGAATVTDNCDTTVPPEVPCVETKQVSTTCLYNYTLYYLCSVTDAAGNLAEHSYTVQVRDTTPPIFYFDDTEFAGVAPADTTAEYGEQPSIDDALMGVVAVDNSEEEIILVVPEITIIQPDPNNDHEFTIIWTYRACDDCGNCAEIDRTITVTDTTPPCLSEEPPSESVDCDNIPPPCEVTTVDEDLTVTTSHSQVFQIGSHKYITRSWTATDLSSNVVSHDQTLTVVDTSAPVFSRYPASETVSCSCDSFPLAPEVNVIDNCDFVTVHFTEDKISGSDGDDNYSLERIWLATDESGNSERHTSVITVEDKESPVLSKTPADRAAQCNNIPAAASVYVKDNCDPDVALTYVESSAVGTCGDTYTINRFWSATDRSGNSISHGQAIQVSDMEAPTSVSEDSQCILPNGQYKEFATGNMFSTFDNCDDSQINVQISRCNSTKSTQGPDAFDVSCHFDAHRSILSVLAAVESDEFDGRTYSVYGEAADRCGNTAHFKRQFWIPFTEEDAAMEGLVCEVADVDDLIG